MKPLSQLVPQLPNQGTFIATPTKITTSHSETQSVTKELSINSHSFSDCLQFLHNAGKVRYGNHFSICTTDHVTIYKLLVYVLQDQEAALKFNINLQKGLLLSGPIGSGKTTLMTLINQFQIPQNRFILKPARDISFEFIQDGYETIHSYSKKSFYTKGNQYHPKTYCFDDLGTEKNLKYFGNECNIMAEILLSRYDLFIQKQMITHLTTNLSATEIENHYGNRVRSRMREMFNLISFDKDTKDKRA